MFAKLEAASFGGEIRIECLRGQEALGRPYRFDIQLTVIGEPPSELSVVIGTAAKLTFEREQGRPFVYQGVIVEARLKVQTADWALYEAVLVPKVWRLGLTKHSNVFTQMKVPDIITKVLDDAGLTGSDVELRVGSHYQEEELVVQYRESDLDFIHRWMEHEGMYYFFEQTEDGEKLVIVDDKSAHDDIGQRAVTYRPVMDEDVSTGESFDIFAVHHQTTVKTVRVADYDYDRPALDVSAEQEVSGHGIGAMVLHRSRFFDPGTASHYALVRAQELKATEVVQHAAGNPLGMSAGHLVDLTDHPNDALNTSYVVTEVVHQCNQVAQDRRRTMRRYLQTDIDELYRVEVSFLDAREQFRLRRTTRRPRIWGYEAGVVDGSADSPYAQIDDQGRYLVKFHFDESDLNDGKASTFVRMAQPHGGGTEGFHFPLRKGTEVIFSFMGGDPDRPVITGVVPNAVTPSPVNGQNHTQNVIRTGSDNHIVLEDQAGAEFISIQTPNQNTGLYFGNPRETARTAFDGEVLLAEIGSGSILLHTDDAGIFSFGTHWGIHAGGFKWEDIDGTVTELYHGQHDNTVEAGGHKHDVKGLVEELYRDAHKTTVTLGRHETVNGGLTKEEYKVGQRTEVTGKRHFQASADEFRDIRGTAHYKASAKSHIEAPAIHINGGESAEMNGTTVNVHGKGITVTGGETITIEAPVININGTTSVTVDTPKWDQTDSKKKFIAAVYEHTIGKKFELAAVSRGFTATKVEGFGFKMELKGAWIESAGTNVGQNGVEFTMDGLQSYLNGFTTIT